MNYRIVVTLQAELDAQRIFQWLVRYSTDGAYRWYEAYEATVQRLMEHAGRCAAAFENGHRNRELKQILFGTAHGRRYRIVFEIRDDEVRLLRVRGPGQAPLDQ